MTAPTLPEPRRYRPDEPCAHPGCLSHVTHPCEGCGRIAGRYPTLSEPRPDDEGREIPEWRKLRASKPAIPYLLYFPSMREVARRHGYALAIHGSMTRDFDLIAVAWTSEASDADTLVEAICAENQLLVTVPDRGDKPHGRRGYTIQGIADVPHGWVDLSVIPPALTPHPAPLGATDEGLRAAVTRYLAALTAREGAWSEPSCIAEYDRALDALRTASAGADWLVSQPDANPLFDEPIPPVGAE